MISQHSTLHYHRKFIWGVLTLSILSIILFVCGLMMGTLAISFKEFLSFFISYNHDIHFVIQLRFLREITAFFCGAMLATGSAILQGLTRNPMIAPDLTGMTSIGCLAIIVCEFFWIKSPILNEILAVGGSIFGFLLCTLLAKNMRIESRLNIVLIGICISFTATAIMQLLILHSPQDMDNYIRFLSGNLYAIRGISIVIVSSIALVTLPFVYLLSRHFNVFSLDAISCQSIGVPLTGYRSICFFAAAILIGSSIIGVGNMGFLGIVAPSIARRLIGDRAQFIFPLSTLLGGFMYLSADILGRTLISPAEISAGIMANILSAPLFLYILFKYYRGQHEWN